MDDRPVIWTAANRRHLLMDHPERGITEQEVEEVMADPNRKESPSPRHGSTIVQGRTRAGRWLHIAYIDHPEGRLPVHFTARGEPR